MQMRQLTFDHIRQLVERIYAGRVAAMLFTGASQFGKSTAMLSFIVMSMILGLPCFVMCPHGSLYSALARAAMMLPRRIRRRVLFINLADRLVSLVDTLHWTTSAELSTVVERNLNIIKGAFGDNIEEDTQPLIDEYMRYAIKAVALLRRPLADAAAAIDPHDPLYQVIVDELSSVDTLLAQKLDSIADLRERDYLQLVGPARRRLDTVLRENTFVRDLLSHRATFRPQEMIQRGMIVIISVQQYSSSNEKMLRDIDQRTFMCLYIVSILDAAYAYLNGSERCPSVP